MASCGVAALIGLVVAAWRRSFNNQTILVAAQFAFFSAAVGYHVVVIFLAGRPPTALGWYFNVVIVAELILMVDRIKAGDKTGALARAEALPAAATPAVRPVPPHAFPLSTQS